jgi:hypothetical protein
MSLRSPRPLFSPTFLALFSPFSRPFLALFRQLFAWCELNYVELLSSLPPFVNRFITEGATGGNVWHYCILEPKVIPLLRLQKNRGNP